MLQRRPLLTSSAALLLATPTAAAPPPVKQFQSRTGLFRFYYPQAWALAYDRTPQRPTGAQVLVGNLKEIDTLSVSSYPKQGSLAQVAAQLVAEVSASPASIRFGEVSNRAWRGGGRRVEYVVETCRGVVEEGLGGEKECKGLNDLTLQTVARHHLLGVVEAGEGELLVVNASAVEARWPVVGEEVEEAFESFMLADG